MRNVKQNELAKRVGISAPLLAAYESGERNPKTEVRYAIAKSLAVDPIELMGIELTEEDEIRFVMKFLRKNTLEMKANPDNTVNITLPEEFAGFCGEYNAIRKAASPGNDEEARREERMLDFYCETWPTYDVSYQAGLQNIDPDEGGRSSLRNVINAHFLNDYENYEKNYLSKYDR